MNSTIETLNRLGAQFSDFAWPMLWQSSLLIAVVLALDLLLARKIRAAVRHALWLVVLVKLLLPPTLALPTGAAWWLCHAPPTVQPVAPPHFMVTYEESTPLPEALPDAVVLPPPPAPQLNRTGGMLLAVGGVSVGLLLWLLLRWAQVIGLARRAALAPEFSGLLEDVRRLAGLRVALRLRLVDQSMSPAVCGLFRPVILLPRLLAEKLSASQLRAVLLHEASHLRRYDIWVNCAQAVLQLLYWWHPLVWMANARLRRVREDAVDDAVMLALAGEADVYAPTLLEVAKLAFQRPVMSLGLVGILESRSALRQRIERLMDFRAPRRAGLTLASLCGILAFSAVALPMGEGPAPVEKEAVAVTPVATPSVPDLAQPTQPARPAQVLIEAQLYEIPTGTFGPLVSGLPINYPTGLDPWWSASPGQMFQLASAFKKSGLAPLARPRIQCDSGQPAQFFVGNDQQGVSLAAVPTVGREQVALALLGSFMATQSNGAVTNRYVTQATVPNLGGLVAQMQYPGESNQSNVMMVLTVKILTNATALPSQLVPLTKPALADGDEGINTLLEEGKSLYEMGRLDEAEIKLQSALASDPGNIVAKKYLTQIQTARQYHGISRRQIFAKLDNIRIPSVRFDQLPLREVVRQLTDMAKQNDPETNGVSISSTNAEGDIDSIVINTSLLVNFRLQDVLDAVVLIAVPPIKYSIRDNGIIFSAQTGTHLVSRTFLVDSTAFNNGLKQDQNNTQFGETSAQNFVRHLGVNLVAPKGKTVFYNVGKSQLYVKATPADLDVIERAVQRLNQPAKADAGVIDTNLITSLIDVPIPPQLSDILSNAAALTEAGKKLYAAGKRSAAHAKFAAARQLDPENTDAKYYLILSGSSRKPEALRERITARLHYIRFPSVDFKYQRLEEVVRQLNAADMQNDPDKVGIKISIVTNAVMPRWEQINAVSTSVPKRAKVRLVDVLADMLSNANAALQYTTEADGMVFSARPFVTNSLVLVQRIIHVNPNTLLAELRPQAATGDVASELQRVLGKAGVDWQSPPGKSCAYDAASGAVTVHVLKSDLRLIDAYLGKFIDPVPQIDLKARFYEVPKDVLASMGKFLNSNSPVPDALSGMLSAQSALVVRRELLLRKGVTVLAEPEITVDSGRPVHMMNGETIPVVTGMKYEAGKSGTSAITPIMQQLDFGTFLDATPRVRADGYTISLNTMATHKEFFGYAKTTKQIGMNWITNSAKVPIGLPIYLPAAQTSSASANVNLRDGQTLMLTLNAPEQIPFGDRDPQRAAAIAEQIRTARKKKGDTEVLVFVTATIVDPTGARVHTDSNPGF